MKYKHISPHHESYRIIKNIGGEDICFGHFKTSEEALPIVEELEQCNWDKSRVKELKEKYNVKWEDKERRQDVYHHITREKNGKYRIQRLEDGKPYYYMTSGNINNVLLERDALVNSNWDVDLWVEQEDHYTYIPELLPEFKKKEKIPAFKYLSRTKLRTGGYRYQVVAKMKDLGKMQVIGTYKTLGEAQQVSLIVQRHDCNYADIIDELEAREIEHSKSNESMRYISKNSKSWSIRRWDNNVRNTKIYGNFKSLEEAKKRRDQLIKVNWDINKIEGGIKEW